MKTCNYRNAQPRLFGKNSEPEGILCRKEPIARYGMTCCYQQGCFLCRLQDRQSKNGELLTGVHFSPNQVHHFVKKYEAILNCPAVSVE